MTTYQTITKQATENMNAAKSFTHFAKMETAKGELVCVVSNKNGNINRNHNSFKFTLNGKKISKEEVWSL